MTDSMNPSTSISTPVAAVHIGVSRQRVVQLIREGKLQAARGRRDWLVDVKSLKAYLELRARVA